MKIISADQRLSAQRGVKALIVGPSGVGKTSLLRTLDNDLCARALFVDIEAGDLAVQDVPVATIRPRTWTDCRDIACVLGGPNPELASDKAYSQAHYDSVVSNPDMKRLAEFDIAFVDSLTALSRLSIGYAETQPEAFNDRGKKDLWGIYGLHARQMIGLLLQLQQAREKHLITVAILEKLVDKAHNIEWSIQIEGGKTSRQLPGIVDELLVMNFVDFGDGKPTRALVCSSPNPWGYFAKDRSGRLDQCEEPNLKTLIDKLTAKSSPAA
jgi:hypothetical protein